VKIVILVVLLILVAPNIARYFSKEESTKPGGILYRVGRRFGIRKLAAFMILGIVAASLLLWVLARRA
jgi:type II secretory pathway component PulF